jgi:hypothetical protein
MGFKKPLDRNNTLQELRRAYVEVLSPYNDGYNAWTIKQDLYRIKFELDLMLEQCPKFADEEEFLKQHEQQRIWAKLKQM